MKKKGAVVLLVCILTLVISLASVAGISYAYYRQAFSGWQQRISATCVVFKLNGNTFDTVTNYDLGLVSRGKEIEIDLSLVVKANYSLGSLAEFSLSITPDPDNCELAEAIEVFKYIDGRYVSAGMLSQVTALTGEAPVNEELNFYYKLVYSAGANDYYEGKGFTFNLTATSNIKEGTTDKYYISSEAALRSLAEDGGDLSGKEIVFTRDIAITVAQPIVFDYPVSFDLAGHTLRIVEGGDITVAYSSNESCAINNSNPFQGAITGGGTISYTLPPNGAYLSVADTLSSSYTHITVENADFHAISEAIQAKLDAYSAEILVTGDELSFVNGFKYYFSTAYPETKRFSLVPPQGATGDDVSIVSATDLQKTEYIISNSYSTPMTRTNVVTFSFTSADGSSAVLYGSLTIRGISAYAIANYWLDTIPDVIRSSVYMPYFDEASSTTLTWHTTNADLVATSGKYLNIDVMNFDSWKNAIVTIGVVAECRGEQARATREYAVTLLNAEERTNILYNNQQIILDEIGSVCDIRNDYVDVLLEEKAGLEAITVTVLDPEQNKNTVGNNYIELSSGTQFDTITVLNKPGIDRSQVIDILVTFTYYDGDINGEAQRQSYSIRKTVTVVGYMASSDLSDPTAFLQQDFDVNAYEMGNSYTFDVRAYTTNGAKVDYEVFDAFKSYIFVENDIYEADPTGVFVLLNGEYIFLDNMYAFTDGEYTVDINGTFILVDGAYVDISEQLANGGIYRRLSRITVLPAKVPAAATTTAMLNAYLWEDFDESGSKLYFADSDGNRLSYHLSLVVHGIYHNIPSEIADYSLYAVLKQYFDVNGDGWIGVNEADIDWYTDGVLNLSATPSSTVVGNVSYSYINARSSNISSLKGIEYFTTAIGFDFSGNSIIDLSYLRELYSLKYLDVSSNFIADMEYLQYLDSLEVIRAQRNLITSIEPLRYLPAVRMLDLYYNEEISSYEAIGEYDNLVYLDIRQENRRASVSDDTSYYLSLVYDANRSNGIRIYRDGSSTWTATPEIIVGARALSEMLVLYEAYKTLNIPSTYYYEYSVQNTTYRKTYNIEWFTGVTDQAYLLFTTENGRTTGYVINTPVVDRNIEITVRVTENGSSNPIAVSHSFVLTLLQSQNSADTAYIETEPGVFTLASVAIPDTTVRNFLFGVFNTTTTGYVGARDSSGALIDGSYTSYPESAVISYAELTRVEINEYPDAFRNAGIKSLKGLSYFKDAVYFALDLRGNALADADLLELSLMSNVQEIRLSGASYDFSKLSSYNEQSGTPVIEGLTGLNRLYVYGSYNLDETSVLAGLYQVYLANPTVSIYKDSDSEVWDPYAGVLDKYMQSLPSAFVVIDLNEEVDYLEGGDNSFVVNFYGVKDVAFSMTTSDSNLSGYFAANFDHITGGIKYHSLAGYSDVVYDRVVMSGSDGRDTLTCDHYFEIKIDFNYKIQVIDYPDTDYSGYVSLDTIFPGRAVRASVLSRLSTLFGGTSASSMDTIGSGFYRVGSYYYITMLTLSSLRYSGTLTIDGTYQDKIGSNAIQGLQYLSVQSIKISRDANLGDGSALANLKELIIAYSGLDFTGISIDLPNMNSIVCGLVTGNVGSGTQENRYTLLYDNTGNEPYYNLKHFTNLTSFVLVDSSCYDFTGLRGLIGRDISKLYIYATSNTFTNANNNTSVTEGIVREIYNASRATTKNYKIGTKSNARSTEAYVGEGWADAILGVTELSQEPIKEYREFAPVMNDLGVRIQGTEYIALADPTVSNGGTISLPATTYAVNYGVSMHEGDPGYSRRFVIEWSIFGMDAVTASSVFGLSGLTTSSMTTSGFENISYCTIPAATNYSDRTLTVASTAYDYYFILVGSIGGGYLNENGGYTSFNGSAVRYTFGYPILIKGTDNSATRQATLTYRSTGSDLTTTLSSQYFYNESVSGGVNTYLSYAAFTDPNLRYLMYLATATQPFAAEKPGTLLYSGVSVSGLLRLSELSLTPTSVAATFLTASESGSEIVNNGIAVNTSVFGKNLATMYVGSLNGLGLAKNLSTVNAPDNYIYDIDDLSGIGGWENRLIKIAGSTYGSSAGLVTLNLENNIVSSLNGLKDITSIENIYLKGNVLKSLEYGGAFVLASAIDSLKVLDLTSNATIKASDIQLIATAANQNGGNSLAKLLLYGTVAVNDENALTALGDIAELSTSELFVSWTDTTEYRFLKQELNAFNSVLATDFSDLITAGYQLDTTFVSSRTLNGISYSLSLVNAANIIDSTGNSLSSLQLRMGTTTTKLIIAMVGSPYSVCKEINLLDQDGNVNATDVVVCGTARTATDFDESLWVWLLNNSTERSGTLVYDPGPVLAITEDIGMRSLKGINYMTSCTSLTIANQAYLKQLWSGSFPSLISFTLSNCPSVTAESLTGLSYATALTTLDLSANTGIDFVEAISFDGTSTTLGNIILGYLTTLSNLYINNSYNFGIYGGNGGRQNLNAYMNGDNYLFGYDSHANAKRLSAFSNLAILKTHAIAPSHSYTNYNSAFVTVKYILDAKVSSYKQVASVNNETNVSSLVSTSSSFETAVRKAALFTTSTSRDIIPNTIYQDAIDTTGVLYYLPSTFYFGGEQMYFQWNMLSGNTEYVTSFDDGYAFAVNSGNALYEDSVILRYSLFTVGGRFLRTETFTITIIPSEVSQKTSSSRLSPYYIEMPNGDNGTKLEPAALYFKSTRLLYWLFNNNNTVIRNAIKQITLTNYSALGMKAEDIGAYYFGYTERAAVTSITMDSQGVTSLDGIDLFPNLTSLSLTSGAVISLNALENLRLTSFAYNSREFNLTDRNYVVQDFSPLFNSRNTLTSFVYTSASYAAIDDMSFLTSFGEQLTSISIGSANSAVANSQSYNQMLSFKYLVDWFATNRPATTIRYNGINQVATDTDSLNATSVLASLSTENSDVDYVNNFELVFKESAEKSANSITAKVPTYINIGGSFYPIEWKSMSAFASFASIVYTGETFTVAINGTARTIQSGSTVTYDEYVALFGNYEFINILYTNKGYFTQSVTLVDMDKNLLKLAYLIARIKVGQYEYERVLSVNCSNEVSYPQISLKSGRGSAYLPIFGNTQGFGGWYIVTAAGGYTSIYQGLEISSFTVGGLTRQVVVINNPETVISGQVKLAALINGNYVEYTLYHDFTTQDHQEITGGFRDDAAAREYIVAVKQNMTQEEYAVYCTNKLNITMQLYEARYAQGMYSAVRYAEITDLYNNALVEIGNASSKYDQDQLLSNVTDALELVPMQYAVHFNKESDGSGEEFDVTQYAEVGTSYTLPIEGDYSLTDEKGNAVTGFLVNGVLYDFGDSFVMPSSNVVIAPSFGRLSFYLVASGSESSYATLGYPLINQDVTVEGKTYDWYLPNRAVVDYENTATLYLSRSYHIVAVDIDGNVTNASIATFTPSDTARYSLYLDSHSLRTSNLESDYFLAVRETYFFTVNGNNAALGSGHNWRKPELDYPLIYDIEAGFYYCTITTTSSSGPQIKVCAYISGSTYSSSPQYGTNFYALAGQQASSSTGNIGLAVNTTYTVYFTPDCYAYTIADNNGNIPSPAITTNPYVGFTGTAGGLIAYATAEFGGILVTVGDYEATRATAISCYSTDLYQ